MESMRGVILAHRVNVGDCFLYNGVGVTALSCEQIRVVTVPSKGAFFYRYGDVSCTTKKTALHLFNMVGVSNVKEFMLQYQSLVLYEGVKAVISGYLIKFE